MLTPTNPPFTKAMGLYPAGSVDGGGSSPTFLASQASYSWNTW